MSLPESTHAIATRVVEDAGGFDGADAIESSVESSVESTEGAAGSEQSATATETPAGDGQAAEQPRAADADELLTELGLKPRTDGREHRIPYKDVKRMRETALRKGREAAAAEWQQKVIAAEQRAAAIDAELTRAVMEAPEQLLRELATINPGLAQFLKFEQQAQAAAQATQAAQFTMPEPDVRLADGSQSYTVKGVQKAILDAMEFATKQAEARMSERFKPFEQTIEQQREAQRRDALYRASEQRVNTLYQDAKQNWPGFTEHEAEIQKAFNEDFKDLPVDAAINAAYRKVVVSKLVAGRNQTREDVIRGLKGAPRSTAIAGSAGAAPTKIRERSTHSVARDVLTRLRAAQAQR